MKNGTISACIASVLFFFTSLALFWYRSLWQFFVLVILFTLIGFFVGFKAQKVGWRGWLTMGLLLFILLISFSSFAPRAMCMAVNQVPHENIFTGNCEIRNTICTIGIPWYLVGSVIPLEECRIELCSRNSEHWSCMVLRAS